RTANLQAKSARGLAQSKTRPLARDLSATRSSWSPPVLWRCALAAAIGLDLAASPTKISASPAWAQKRGPAWLVLQIYEFKVELSSTFFDLPSGAPCPKCFCRLLRAGRAPRRRGRSGAEGYAGGRKHRDRRNRAGARFLGQPLP